MAKATILLLITTLLLNNYTYCQGDSLSQYIKTRIIKTSISQPIFRGLLKDPAGIGITVESEDQIKKKVSVTAAFDFSKTFSEVRLNGVLVSRSKNLKYSIRPGIRYYFKQYMNGFFLGANLLYERDLRLNKFRKEHDIGIIAGFGYQKILSSRITFDGYIYFGHGKSWYKSMLSGQSPSGTRDTDVGRLRINIGYRF